MNRVCEAFELVKEAEMERFGEKSYFYRKMNGLSPADSDDDPGLVGDDVHGCGFEEPEEEEGVGVLEEEAMPTRCRGAWTRGVVTDRPLS